MRMQKLLRIGQFLLVVLLLATPAWAAFPTVVTTNTSVRSGNGTDHVVSLPSGIVSGNLILVFMEFDGIPVVTNADYTQLLTIASNPRLEAWFRRADGTEGATTTFTSSTSETSSHLAYRITGHHATSDPEGVETVGGGTSANPDPPDFNPTGWGTEDTLWFAAYVWDNGNTTNSSYPTNYDSNQLTITSGAGAARGGVAAATDEVNAASENPGTGTISSSSAWEAVTVAIRPAGAAAAVRRKVIAY